MNSVETVFEPTWPWPAWTAILGLLVLASAAWILYRREPTRAGAIAKAILLACRMGTLALLVWTLGGWQRQQHRTEPAHLIVAIDDSVSMSFADDFRDPRARSRLQSLLSDTSRTQASSTTQASRLDLTRSMLEHSRFGWLPWLQQNYRVKVRLIADSVRPLELQSPATLQKVQPVRPASKLGHGLREILTTEEGVPVAAILVFTDGVTTSGATLTEAAESAERQGIPLYLIGMGGGQQPRDLRLADLVADDVAFAGDIVQIEVQVLADGLSGQETTLQLKHATTGEVLAEQRLKFEKEAARTPVQLAFRPQSVGSVSLAIEATTLPGESDTANNRLTHSLEVNDVPIKVLLVQAYPSYEYRFLKNLLGRATRPTDSSAKAFELTTILQEADREHVQQDPTAAQLFPVTREELFQFDVVLFGDVDPTLLGRTAMEHLVSYVREHGGSLVFMSGPRFTPQSYAETPLSQLFPFDPSLLSMPDSAPYTEPFQVRLTTAGAISSACRLENSSAANKAVWTALPELFWFVEVEAPHPSARVLVEHASRLTSQRRPLPLVLTQYLSAGQVVFHATDETYRWSRFQGSDTYYARYWIQTLRALSRPKLLAGQSLAELSTDRQQYQGGEDVHVRVRFRQPPSNPDQVSVMLQQQNGSRQSVSLRPQESSTSVFTAQIPGLLPGTYRLLLSSPLLDPAPVTRTFTIADRAQEQVGAARNAATMQEAAAISGGKYFDWFQADRILRELPRGQRVRVESLPPENVWNSPFVAALFVVLLTVEWLLRKRNGML